jgi:hypothetical protein
MSKNTRIWRRSNTYGLLFIAFCCGVAIGASVVML